MSNSYQAEKVGCGTKGGPKDTKMMEGKMDQKKSVKPDLQADKHYKK